MGLAADGYAVFRDSLLARIIELDSLRVMEETGVAAARR
jgi:hypothetical protein